MASNWPVRMVRVRRHDATPGFAALWLGEKKAKILWHQSEARTTPAVWNWSVKTLSPGALLLFLDFSLAQFFLARLNFFPTPLTAPGSPRMHFFSLSLISLKSPRDSSSLWIIKRICNCFMPPQISGYWLKVSRYHLSDTDNSMWKNRCVNHVQVKNY